MTRSVVVAESIELYAFLRDSALGRIGLAAVLLASLGAVGGALSAATAFLAFVAISALTGGLMDGLSIGDAMIMALFASAVGAVLGAGSATVAGWLFMRRVPLWRSMLEPGATIVLTAAACGPLGLEYAIPAAVGAFWLSSARLGWSHRPAALAAGRRGRASSGRLS